MKDGQNSTHSRETKVEKNTVNNIKNHNIQKTIEIQSSKAKLDESGAKECFTTVEVRMKRSDNALLIPRGTVQTDTKAISTVDHKEKKIPLDPALNDESTECPPNKNSLISLPNLSSPLSPSTAEPEVTRTLKLKSDKSHNTSIPQLQYQDARVLEERNNINKYPCLDETPESRKKTSETISKSSYQKVHSSNQVSKMGEIMYKSCDGSQNVKSQQETMSAVALIPSGKESTNKSSRMSSHVTSATEPINTERNNTSGWSMFKEFKRKFAPLDSPKVLTYKTLGENISKINTSLTPDSKTRNHISQVNAKLEDPLPTSPTSMSNF